MVSSMTGYGTGQIHRENWQCITEIRSVNQRFLDIRLRLPNGFSPLESPLKDMIKKTCQRGKIDCTIRLEPESDSLEKMELNVDLVRNYIKVIRKFEEVANRSVHIDLKDLLSIKDLIAAPEIDPETPLFRGLVQDSLAQALEQLVQMKQHEGGALWNDIQQRLNKCSQILDAIENTAKELPAIYHKRLLDNISSLNPNIDIEENRILQEIALFADRSDVTEEVVRFRTHLQHMEEIFQGREIGKKAEFLLQEMNREINTIASKGSHTQIAQSVVQVKSELEKIREQIQNIE